MRPALFASFRFNKNGVDWKVNTDISNFISDVWRYQPIIIVLVVVGLIVFFLLIINTHRYRKKQKKRHPKKH